MATMKDLFTYPNDSGTFNISADYLAGVINATDIESGGRYKIITAGTTDYTTVGSANNNPGTVFTATGTPTGTGTVYIDTTGFLGRFRDLVNGDMYDYPMTYGASTNVPNVIIGSSKFVNYFDQLTGSQRELSMYDFYYNPLLTGDKDIISGSLGSADTSNPINFTITGHGFVQGEKYLASNFNSTLVALNSNEYFVKYIDADTIQLATDSGLTDLVQYNVSNQSTMTADVTTAATSTFTQSGHGFSDTDQVRINATTGTMAELDNLQLFVQNSTASTLELSWDSGGTDLLKFQDVDTDNDIDEVVVGTGTLSINLQSAEPQHLSHAKVVFDEPASYLASPETLEDNMSGQVGFVSDYGDVVYLINTTGGTPGNELYRYSDTSYNAVTVSTVTEQLSGFSGDGKYGFRVGSPGTGPTIEGSIMHFQANDPVLTLQIYNTETDTLVQTIASVHNNGATDCGKTFIAADGDGDVVAISMAGADQIKILEESGGSWSVQHTLTPNQLITNQQFGRDIQISTGGDFLYAYDNGDHKFYKESGGSWSETDDIEAPTGITPSYVLSSTTRQVTPKLSKNGSNFIISGGGGILHYKYNGSTWGSPITVTTDTIYSAEISYNGLTIHAVTSSHVKVFKFNVSTQSWSEDSSTAYTNLNGGSSYFNMLHNSREDVTNNMVLRHDNGTINFLKLNSYRNTAAETAIKYINATHSELFVKDTGTDQYQIYSDRALTTAVDVPTQLLGNGTYDGQNAHADIGDTRTNGSVTITEVSNPGDDHIIDEASPATVTQGTLTISTSESHRYHIDTFNFLLPGAQAYTYQNASNVTTAGAQVDPTNFWKAGETSSLTYSSQGATAPTVTFTQTSDGYITNAVIATTGRFTDTGTIMMPVLALGDVFVARTLTTAESEDVFDTQDYWVDPSFNLLKNWPTVVTPSSAKITVNQPSTVNITQSGRKFVRNSGITKWQLEVNYPAMTKYEFEEYQAVAQAVQGQNIPFYFILRNDDNQHILMSNNYTNTAGATALQIGEKTLSGSSVVKIVGFDANQTNAFNKGEVIIMSGSRNGTVHTVIHDADANAYGETKVRLAYPLTSTVNTGLAQKNPYHVVVTLSEDAFEYQVSTEDYYFLTVTFDLDEWK